MTGENTSGVCESRERKCTFSKMDKTLTKELGQIPASLWYEECICACEMRRSGEGGGEDRWNWWKVPIRKTVMWCSLKNEKNREGNCVVGVESNPHSLAQFYGRLQWKWTWHFWRAVRCNACAQYAVSSTTAMKVVAYTIHHSTFNVHQNTEQRTSGVQTYIHRKNAFTDTYDFHGPVDLTAIIVAKYQARDRQILC